MPDLNLQEDDSLENLESSKQSEDESVASDEEGGKKAGLMRILIIVLAVVIVGGGGAFLLDKLGVVQIFGKKKAAPAVAQLQEGAGTAESTAQTPDAGQAQMIETPPLDEKGAAGAKQAAAKQPAKPSATQKTPAAGKEMPGTEPVGKLDEMKGEYTIQVSAWRDKEIAEEIGRRLTDAGYPAFVEERAFSGANWFTVRVGRYPSRKDAEVAVQNFAEEIRSNYWIDKARAK